MLSQAKVDDEDFSLVVDIRHGVADDGSVFRNRPLDVDSTQLEARDVHIGVDEHVLDCAHSGVTVCGLRRPCSSSLLIHTAGPQARTASVIVSDWVIKMVSTP